MGEQQDTLVLDTSHKPLLFSLNLYNKKIKVWFGRHLVLLLGRVVIMTTLK